MQSTYRVMNRRLTLFGIDRQCFLSGMAGGVGLWMLFDSLLFGLGVWLLFCVAGIYQAKDPTAMAIFLTSRRYRPRYDPAKRR